jgi:hypothetical protein
LLCRRRTAACGSEPLIQRDGFRPDTPGRCEPLHHHNAWNQIMNFEAWTKLLGKSQDDDDLLAAIAEAGVKRIPKLRDDETFVQVELKGHGLEIILTDEAILKELADQGLGEGPLVLSGVIARLDTSQGRDLYTGPLPSGITATLSQAALRTLLGKPDDSDIDVDNWMRGDLELGVDYTKGGAALASLSVMLPNAL